MTGHLQRAELLLQTSRYDEAEKELRQVLAQQPNDPFTHALMGVCLSRQKKHESALQAAHRAVNLGPEIPYSHYALASVLNRHGRHGQAEQAVREAVRLDPANVNHHGLMAATLLARGRWEEALKAAERGLELDAEDVQCANLRSTALTQLGRRDEAAQSLDAALHKEPDNAHSHANLGWARLHANDYRGALEHFREALRLEPGMEWARMGIVEALKARNPIYRLMLRYFLWMTRLSGKMQWGLIIGLFVLYQIVEGVSQSNPQLRPLLVPLMVAYIGFAVLTWLAAPLFNLMLRLDRFGRYALSRDQIVGANWVGALLMACVICAVSGWWLESGLLLMAAVGLGLMLLPLAGLFALPAGEKRRPVVWYVAALAAVGALTLGLSAMQSEAATLMGFLFVIGAIGGQFLANLMMTRA